MEPTLYLEIMAALAPTLPQPAALQDPTPLDPPPERVADRARPVLRWEPVEGAQGYRVEVAPTPAFDAPCVEEEVPAGQTSLALRRGALDGEGTWYWRVRVRYARGWSPGDRVGRITGVASPDTQGDHEAAPTHEGAADDSAATLEPGLLIAGAVVFVLAAVVLVAAC